MNGDNRLALVAGGGQEIGEMEEVGLAVDPFIGREGHAVPGFLHDATGHPPDRMQAGVLLQAGGDGGFTPEVEEVHPQVYVRRQLRYEVRGKLTRIASDPGLLGHGWL